MHETDLSGPAEPDGRANLRALATAALLVLSACTRQDRSVSDPTTMYLGEIDWETPDVVLEQGAFPDLGAIDQPAELQFGILSWATFLPNGGVFAGDQASKQLRVFDSNGNAVAEHGGMGDGPGEYRSIGWIGRCSPNSVTVYDYTLHRLTEVSFSGALLGTRRIPDRSGYLVQMVRCHSSGRYVIAQRDVTSMPVEEGRYRTSFLLQTMTELDGKVEDIGVVMGEDRYRYPTSEMPATLGASIGLAVDSERIFVSSGTEAEVVEIDLATGDTTQVISWAASETPVDDRLREAVIESDLDQVRGYVSPSTLVTRRRLWDRTEFPSHLPETYDLFLDEASRMLWIEAWRPPVEKEGRGSLLLGVSLSSSLPARVVSMPPRYSTFEISSNRVIGKARDALDVGLLSPRRLVW